jgi:hypothetical protein
LPWAQADLRVSYIVNQEKVSTAGLDDNKSLGSGLGDIEIGLTKQLLRESDVAPDLLGAVRWRAPTGDSAFEIDDDEGATGSGFHAISGHVTAVKSREPFHYPTDFNQRRPHLRTVEVRSQEIPLGARFRLW